MFLRTLWISPREHPDFAWGFLGRALLYLAFYLFSSYQLYIMQDHVGLGSDAVDFIPVVGGITLLGIIIGAAVAGPLSDRIGRRKPVLVVAGLLMAAALGALLVAPTTGGLIVFAVLTGLGFGAYQSVDTALMSEVLPCDADRGKDMGVVGLASGIPTVLAGGIAGALVITVGYTALFAVATAVAVAGSLVVLKIRSVR